MSWDRPPILFADGVEQNINNKYRGLIASFYNNLVMLSPVDTGRYLNNHHVSFNVPSYAIDGAIGFMLPPMGTFPIVYIQNNLPYGMRLEQGHSNKAPTGVYQNAFNSAVLGLR